VQAFAVLLNSSAGPGHANDKAAALRAAFREAGARAQVAVAGRGEDLRRIARELLDKRPLALVAAGGDGTVSTLADVVRGTGTPLGIVPSGTLNHFAKDLGIPLDMGAAARAIVQGKPRAVDVGEVNGSAFLNNASLGLYPGIVKERARQQRRLRRSKRAAMLWATLAVMNRPPLLDLQLELDGKVQDCRAPFVFVGNNDYVLEGFDIGRRGHVDCGVLNVYTTRSCTPRGLLALALRALAGRLRQADDFMESSVSALRVASRRRQLLVATDGEVRMMATPLEFRIVPRSLQVLVP
jgi:diacylglycerol kinase family enzyme